MQALNKTPGVKGVCPPREQMIALDALHSLLTEAYSGDLTHDDKIVSAEQVDGWARESIAAAGHELVLCVYSSMKSDWTCLPGHRLAEQPGNMLSPARSDNWPRTLESDRDERRRGSPAHA